MLGKTRVLARLADLFMTIEKYEVQEIDELDERRLKKLIKDLNKLATEVIALIKLIRLSLPAPPKSKYLHLSVEKDGDKYLFKPFRVKDFAYPNFPYLVVNKTFIENWAILYKILKDNGFEMEIIRGYIPFARWGNFATRLRLLESHSKGKSLDFLIKGFSAEESMEILEKLLKDYNLPLTFYNRKDYIHVQLAPFFSKQFRHNYARCYDNCHRPNPNPFLEEEQ